MIASHDTFTYLKARNWIINIISNFWRCQNLTIKLLYKAGVRYFDIRVYRDEDKWRICHGLAEFNKTFSTLRLICTYVSNNFPKAIFRLMLEKGDCALFREEVRMISGKYKSLVSISIKLTGETIYRRENHPEWVDYSFENWTFWNIIKSIFKSIIKNNSKKYTITQEMIDDLSKVYLIDFIK